MGLKYQRGYINLGTTRDWLLIFGIAAASVAGVTLGITNGVNYMVEDKQEFRTRATDAIDGKYLTTISIAPFKRSDVCKKEGRAFSAAFVAKDKANTVVEGTVCIAKDREAIVKLKP